MGKVIHYCEETGHEMLVEDDSLLSLKDENRALRILLQSTHGCSGMTDETGRGIYCHVCDFLDRSESKEDFEKRTARFTDYYHGKGK